MKTHHISRSRQQGAALIVGLILLVVATLVALSSMRGTQVQERVTSNQSQKVISLMAAEAGAAKFSEWIIDLSNPWGGNSWNAVIPTTKAGAPNVGAYGYYFIDEDDPNAVDWSTPNEVVVKLTGVAKNDNSANALSTTVLELRFMDPTGTPPNPAFGAGLLSDEDIDLKGNCTISGSAHANGNFECTGGASQHIGGSGILSAVGTVDHAGAENSAMQAGAPAQDVPKVTDDVLNNIKGLNAGNITYSCNVNVDGDQSGMVYFCEGNMTVSGSHSNATFASTGNITYNGSGQRGGVDKSGTAVTVAVIAKNNITFNGSSSAYGVFWSGNTYTHNGAGQVKGSIVAGSDIRRNGVFNFEQIEEFDNSALPGVAPTNRFLLSWRELV